MERGHDPAAYTLVSFGGAGPVHAYGVARRLGISRIVVPQSAGVGSALGLHLAPRSYHLARTLIGVLEALDWAAVEHAFSEMTQEAADVLKGVGVSHRNITFTRIADMRYMGQRKELAVTLPAGKLNAKKTTAIRRVFEESYQKIYRRVHEGHEIEALTWRLIATGPPIVEARELHQPVRTGDAGAPTGHRPMLFDGWVTPRDCPVYSRLLLSPGDCIQGPGAIEEIESTIVLGPEAHAEFDRHGNILIELVPGD